MTLNQTIFLFIHHFAGRYAFADGVGIFFAEYLAYFMVAAFLVLVYYQSGWRRKMYLFCEGAIAIMLSRGIVTEVIRFFYHHQRPFSFYNFVPLIQEQGWSFPSGHMAWFFAMSLTVWYVNRTWGWWFFGLSTVMGVARVYVGVHWPLDIVGGMVVGLVCAWVVHRIFKGTREALYRAHAPHRPPDAAPLSAREA
ncbi:MAG TPA: phosphatase PAP2 family protein [Candidatus Paceibacterota bacterium]|jgi:undecaprenyl-diphosphatase|nr:phosphatase PAP2 family protein [Candidatus Paceibacterota bacterium]